MDLAAKGDFLYADNAADLVVFDIRQLAALRVARRVAGAFPAGRFRCRSSAYPSVCFVRA